MPNPRLYPKLSTQAIVQSKGFDPNVPSPLSQAYSRRMVEQQIADAKAKDMRLSPLDRAVAGLEAVAMAGSAMFEAIQQAPKLLQGEEAYTQAIGNRMYMPRQQPEKAGEYLGNAMDAIDRLQTEYKLPPIMPELAGFQPLAQAAQQQVGQGIKRGALQAGTAVERALDKPVTDVMNRGGFGAQMLGSFNTQPAQVIKPKGGNWLTGDVEKQVGKMKMADTTPPETLAENQKAIDAAKRIMGNDPAAQRAIAQMENEMSVNKRNNAINDWIDRNLTNYIKKEMATPEDPVRKLAEQGITHKVDLGDYRTSAGTTLLRKRGEAGFPLEGMGQSDLAKQWENLADYSFISKPAKDVSSERYPWVSKLDPDTPVYGGVKQDINQHLSFDHIVDVLRQDVREGRIRPEQLNKVSMEQAVRRTHEYDMEQAKKMREAAIKNQEGFPVHKEYPEGYKWVELKTPEALTELPPTHQLEPYESKVHGGTAYRVVNKETGMKGEGFKTPERATQEFLKSHSEERLAEALKYEGDTMGHCVGGYCPDVLEGRSRIYSLRDARGEPHVTVEVAPTQYAPRWEKVKPYLESAREQVMKDRMANGLPLTDQYENEIERLVEAYASKMALENTPPEIRQIKGKQNAAPKADYLPYVQDFVKSGQWSDVGDLKNTGLYKIDKDFLGATSAFMPEAEDIKHLKMPQREEALMKAIEAGDLPESGYATRGEWEEAIRKHGSPTIGEVDDELLRQLQPPVEGMKRGGKVHISDNPDTMMMELEDQKFQVGGIVDKAVRLAKAAKAAEMKQAMKASEALAKIEGKRLNITQADRTKVGQGFLGGPGFSGLQLQEGPHKDVGAVWGVKNVGTAKTMLGGFKDPLGKEYFTTMIGSPTQHQSNQMVFDKLYNQFKAEAKKGNLDPELRDKINARLAAAVDKDGNPIFPPDVDILDKNFKKQATTFDQRAVAGNVIGGTGVGGKKGQIIDYDKIIRETTDPFLLDAPSGSLGYRLWTPSGEIIERPDLHPAFPAIATGEDLGVEFTPAAQDILMEPWVKNIRETKGRNPGYMDWTRGRPPSVEVTEDILTNLQKSGNKAGGLIKVKRKAGGGIIKKAIQAAGKAAEAVAPATKRLEMSFKDVTKPIPELTEAAQKLKAGKLSREEYEALVNQHKPVAPYSFVPQPATAEDATRALNSAKREKFGKTKDIPAGTPAGLRLDIPAYKEHGVWVNSVHPEDMPTAYTNVSSVTNAEMIMPEDKALSVATREANKSPFAVIKGGWNPITEEEAVAKATEYLNHPDWVQVGIDPERHGYYYNRATMEPIVKADEVIQIGPLVLAKNPVTAPKEAFKYARGGAITANDLILTERPL